MLPLSLRIDYYEDHAQRHAATGHRGRIFQDKVYGLSSLRPLALQIASLGALIISVVGVLNSQTPNPQRCRMPALDQAD